MDSEFRHSIITPTFNRENWLKTLYSHMLELDYPREEFEWVIVDDGSQDGTSTVVQDIIRDELISVQFFRQPNLGIHIAQNRAIELAKGRFVTRIDTDDYLLPGALSEMDEIWDAIPPEHKESFVGIVGLTLNPDLSPRCSQLAHATIDCTGVELRRLHGATGDRSFCMRTAVMRSYPIPAYGDTKYVPESIVWRRIDREYVTRFSNAAFSVMFLRGGRFDDD